MCILHHLLPSTLFHGIQTLWDHKINTPKCLPAISRHLSITKGILIKHAFSTLSLSTEFSEPRTHPASIFGLVKEAQASATLSVPCLHWNTEQESTPPLLSYQSKLSHIPPVSVYMQYSISYYIGSSPGSPLLA